MGNTTVVYRDNPERIKELQDQINALRAEADKSQKEYNAIRDFINSRRIGLAVGRRVALLGPKASGKSTFLWKKRLLPRRPQPTAGDGTTSTEYLQIAIDTVGVNIEVPNLVKLFAVLLKNPQNLPAFFVLLSRRPVRDVTCLKFCYLDNFVVCCLEPALCHVAHDNPSAAASLPLYNETVEREVRALGCQTIRDSDDLTALLDSSRLSPFATLFGSCFELPPFEQFDRDDPVQVSKVNIARGYFELMTRYAGDERAFLNSI